MLDFFLLIWESRCSLLSQQIKHGNATWHLHDSRTLKHARPVTTRWHLFELRRSNIQFHYIPSYKIKYQLFPFLQLTHFWASDIMYNPFKQQLILSRPNQRCKLDDNFSACSTSSRNSHRTFAESAQKNWHCSTYAPHLQKRFVSSLFDCRLVHANTVEPSSFWNRSRILTPIFSSIRFQNL
jgi:hypothetical protein